VTTANDPWGRVDADGTVYVRTADGERVIGSWAAGSPEEAIVFFRRKFESLETEVPSMTAGAVMLASSLVVTSAFVLARRHPVVWPARVVGRWLIPGTFVGLSYIALFEAFYRGTVSVVAPIVATESLFGVVFSALLLRRTERIGRGSSWAPPSS